MKFISYKCEFAGKINELHILISEKSNREIPGFFKISRDISRLKIEPGSRELNPSFHQYINPIEKIYQGKFSPDMMVHYCWSLQRDDERNEENKRKSKVSKHF